MLIDAVERRIMLTLLALNECKAVDATNAQKEHCIMQPFCVMTLSTIVAPLTFAANGKNPRSGQRSRVKCVPELYGGRPDSVLAGYPEGFAPRSSA